MLFGSIAADLNLYLVCSYVFSSELRDAVAYPIFLLTLIDFLTTGPGYLLCYVSREFILYHPSNFPEEYISQGFEFYEAIRRQIQLLVQQPIAQNVHPFWFGCLPHLFITRLNEYGNGLCSILIAYERFVLICKPTQKDTLLSKKRRRLGYVIITTIIVLIFAGESFYHYFYRHFTCYYLIQEFEHAQFGHLINLISNLVFSVLPALLCCYYYSCIAKVLFSRQKKIGRNLNLIFCFAVICIVWIISIIVKLLPLIYYNVSSFDIFGSAMLLVPFELNIGNLHMVTLLSGITSLVDPILILVSQKDYRKPFYNFWKKLKRIMKRGNE